MVEIFLTFEYVERVLKLLDEEFFSYGLKGKYLNSISDAQINQLPLVLRTIEKYKYFLLTEVPYHMAK